MAAAQSSGKSSRQGHAREALLGQGLSWLQENYAECDPESQWINTLKEMTMAQFLWTDDLSTGNSMIDNDHRKLINMANSFFDAMSNGQGNEIQSKVLNNLIAYTKEHFSREEAEMQRINYSSSIAHKNEHTKLIKQVGELKAKLDSGAKLNAVAIFNFLSDWLRNHILLVDKKLALALKQ